jgi:hypothetical protein
VGYSALGIEYLPAVAYAARRIARAEKREFEVIEGDVLTDEVQERFVKKNFSVVLAINIFHHFIKTEAGCRKLESLLKKLQTQTLFFQPHRSDELQMQGAYANFNTDEFVGFVKACGSFRSATAIHTSRDGRTLFKMER